MSIGRQIVGVPSEVDLEFIGTLTHKGGVTIPLEVRRMLKVKPKDKVVFRVQGERIELDTLPMSLEDTFGSVEPINRPENFPELIRIAKEERADRVIAKMNS